MYSLNISICFVFLVVFGNILVTNFDLVVIYMYKKSCIDRRNTKFLNFKGVKLKIGYFIKSEFTMNTV